MKKLAIMGSGNGGNFEAIVKYFKGKDIEITCLSDIKDALILKRAQNLGIKNQYLPFEKNLNYFSQNKFDLVALAGYMRILSDEILNKMDSKIINIHPSLLPSFKGNTRAIKEAFLSGVKVSGVTIHWVDSSIDGGKIIAQYPVFINNDNNFNDFKEKIHNLEHKLYPVVIEKILEDKVFDFQDLMKSNCSGGCNSCKRCVH